MTGRSNVGRDLSMIRIVGIFCFGNHVGMRWIVAPSFDLRDFILSVKRRLHQHLSKLSAKRKRNDRRAILGRDLGLVASSQGGLYDTVGKNPELKQTIVDRSHGRSRGTLSWNQTRTNLGLIPGVFIADHLNRVLRSGTG